MSKITITYNKLNNEKFFYGVYVGKCFISCDEVEIVDEPKNKKSLYFKEKSHINACIIELTEKQFQKIELYLCRYNKITGSLEPEN